MECSLAFEISISSVQCKSAIYIFLCMYSFFYGRFTRASTNNLDSAMNCTFLSGGSRRKGNKFKVKVGKGERSQTEKEEARLEVRLIAKQAIILILSSLLVYSMLCIS